MGIKVKWQTEKDAVKYFMVPKIFNIEPQEAKWHHITRAFIINRKNRYTHSFYKTKFGKKVRLIRNKISYKIEDYYESNFYAKWFKLKTNAKLLFGLLKWVNVYTITRHYGGPEEGGWWYNYYECQESYLIFRWSLRKTLAKAKMKWRHSKHGDIYSVLGGTNIWIGEEKHKAESETTERPYYC